MRHRFGQGVPSPLARGYLSPGSKLLLGNLACQALGYRGGMPLWGFVFCLAAAIVFAVDFALTKAVVALGLCLLAVGIILTYATSTAPVHF